MGGWVGGWLLFESSCCVVCFSLRMFFPLSFSDGLPLSDFLCFFVVLFVFEKRVQFCFSCCFVSFCCMYLRLVETAIYCQYFGLLPVSNQFEICHMFSC